MNHGRSLNHQSPCRLVIALSRLRSPSLTRNCSNETVADGKKENSPSVEIRFRQSGRWAAELKVVAT